MAGNDALLYNAKHWELHAEKMRAITVTMRDPEARAMMATVIDTYEQMAQRAVTLSKLLRPNEGKNAADANR